MLGPGRQPSPQAKGMYVIELIILFAVTCVIMLVGVVHDFVV
jgi:hypothetical protein